MRRSVLPARLPALLLVTTLAVAACGGSDGGDNVATDPGGTTQDEKPAPPQSTPAAPGDVRSRTLVTVMDVDATDDLVELCLGPIAESYPPQCGGPAITNWDWSSLDGMFEQQGDVRWGTYAVTGTWDGESFTVSESIPAALYDPMPEEPPTYPEPSEDYTDEELAGFAEDLMELPGVQGAYGADGHVLVDVTYDDGSYQDYADEAYGEGVVVVTGALVDVA